MNPKCARPLSLAEATWPLGISNAGANDGAIVAIPAEILAIADRIAERFVAGLRERSAR